MANNRCWNIGSLILEPMSTRSWLVSLLPAQLPDPSMFLFSFLYLRLFCPPLGIVGNSSCRLMIRPAFQKGSYINQKCFSMILKLWVLSPKGEHIFMITFSVAITNTSWALTVFLALRILWRIIRHHPCPPGFNMFVTRKLFPVRGLLRSAYLTGSYLFLQFWRVFNL